MLHDDLMAGDSVYIMIDAALILEKFMVLRQVRYGYIVFPICRELNLLTEYLPHIISGIMELEQLREGAAGDYLLPIFVLVLPEKVRRLVQMRYLLLQMHFPNGFYVCV